MKIHFTASESEDAQSACESLIARYGDIPAKDAEIIVALGGDGFMLETMHAFMDSNLAIYGMN
jgi:NAD+ kinase